MAHHKRRRPKFKRAGCLMCKAWKSKRTAKGYECPERPASERRRLQDDGE